jgi:hypothetical protein
MYGRPWIQRILAGKPSDKIIEIKVFVFLNNVPDRRFYGQLTDFIFFKQQFTHREIGIDMFCREENGISTRFVDIKTGQRNRTGKGIHPDPLDFNFPSEYDDIIFFEQVPGQGRKDNDEQSRQCEYAHHCHRYYFPQAEISPPHTALSPKLNFHGGHWCVLHHGSNPGVHSGFT